MTYKQRETAREVRLWIGQIIIPACTAGIMLFNIPGVKGAIAEKANQLKKSIKPR